MAWGFIHNLPSPPRLELEQLKNTLTALQTGLSDYVPTSRKINNQSLNSDLTLSNVVALTIAKSAWKTNNDATTKAAGYLYCADVTVSGLETGNSTHTSLSAASFDAAMKSGMAGTSSATAGTIRYYAVKIPETSLTAQVTVIKQNSGSPAGYGSVNTVGAALTEIIETLKTVSDTLLTLDSRLQKLEQWTDDFDTTMEGKAILTVEQPSTR